MGEARLHVTRRRWFIIASQVTWCKANWSRSVPTAIKIEDGVTIAFVCCILYGFLAVSRPKFITKS
jgi:hypothetical protein